MSVHIVTSAIEWTFLLLHSEEFYPLRWFSTTSAIEFLCLLYFFCLSENINLGQWLNLKARKVIIK